MANKILVADDEPSIVRVLEYRLRHNGYEVAVARDGKNCLEKIREEKPDLILLDVAMPELDGFEVCKRLKENDETKDIPVIMLTVLATEEDLSQGLERGATCFMSKPFNAADLLAEIKTAIAHN